MDAYLFFREIDEEGLQVLYSLVDDGLLRLAAPTIGDVAAVAALEAESVAEVQDVVARLRGLGLRAGASTVALGWPVPLPMPLRKDKMDLVTLASCRVAPAADEAFQAQVNDDPRIGAATAVVGGRVDYLIEITASDVNDIADARRGLQAIDGVRVSAAISAFENTRGGSRATAE